MREVADKTNSPLYSLDAKELGNATYRISETLDRIMTRAAEWKSIILLNGDFADFVFKG